MQRSIPYTPVGNASSENSDADLRRVTRLKLQTRALEHPAPQLPPREVALPGMTSSQHITSQHIRTSTSDTYTGLERGL